MTTAAGPPLEVKVLPPPPAEGTLDRPELLARLDEGQRRRLVTVIAGPGYGKSTLLARWASTRRAVWYAVTPDDRDVSTLVRGIADALRLRVPGPAPEPVPSVGGPEAGGGEASRARAHAAAFATSLQHHLTGELTIVLDDVHELERGSPAAALVEALARQLPTRVHLVLSSRGELPFAIERLRAQGQVAELVAPSLAFTVDETAGLLADTCGADAAALAPPLHARTHGWPAAVRLAAEALRDTPAHERSTVVERLGEPDGPVFSYLVEEVLANEDPSASGLMHALAWLERFTAELASTLLDPAEGADRPAGGHAATLARLERRGVFVVPLGGGWYGVHPLLREVLRARSGGAPRGPLVRAAAWYDRNGQPIDALRSLAATGDPADAAAGLAAYGQAVLAAGGAATVVDLAASLTDRTPELEQLEGEARHVLGDWEGALRCLERVAPKGGPIPAAAAWRLGLIHHLRGALDAAVAVYERAEDGDPHDRALLDAWHAAALWLRGERDRCAELASAAERVAREIEDHGALAAAHTALAMLAALDGDRRANDAHYLRAIDHAERAGDVLQLVRIRSNRGSRHLEEGEYPEALAELDEALRLADLAGFASFRAFALGNRGEVLCRIDRYEEAQRDLAAAMAIEQRLGSMVSYPLGHLGDVYSARGEVALARVAYEEAVALAEAAGDLQGLVPTLSGLAVLVADDDPDEAARLIERALSAGPALGAVRAVIAAGRVALAAGDRVGAAKRSEEADAIARSRRDRASIAEALELRAAATEDQRDARRALEEARGIWEVLGSPAGVVRVDLELAALADEPHHARELALRCAREARRLGARGLAARAAALVDRLANTPRAPLTLRCLGAFRVERDGEPVPHTAWQSRKARDLVKVLTVRRGQPMHREELAELLWPDEDPSRVGARLSVALSTARAVLDPGKALPSDAFLASDGTTMWLAREHTWVDVDGFLFDAEEALALDDAGDPAAAELLTLAEAAYTGDVLGEDRYEEFPVPLREQARATYLRVLRSLARRSLDDGDADAAVRALLRLLERDPYDEGAHLALVRGFALSGRHGEARRAYEMYCGRMAELDVEPAMFPV
jgi:ATP/maltotriose-dependent transcriptional regulator MalT/DNA-binding SARP family transcriptional activator